MMTKRVAGVEQTVKADRPGPGRIPAPEGVGALCEAGYVIRFAVCEEDLERVLRLRFRIFNEELGEGLSESWQTGLDRDRFDSVCHHLMLIHEATDELVGTYRMQTVAMARTNAGFYTDQEFGLEDFPEEVLGRTVELGRACIEKEHRNGHALYALWRGLALYMTWSGMRYLIGCCSLTSQDPSEGYAMQDYLEGAGHMNPDFRVKTRDAFLCSSDGPVFEGQVEVPRLFSTYLRYGAVVCSTPALDRAFGTIDFLICLDIDGLDARVRSLFFENFGEALRLEDA